DIAKITMRIGVVRPQRQCSPILDRCCFQTALLLQCGAKVVVCLGKIWSERYGTRVMSNRVFQTTNCAQAQSDIIVKRGNPIVQGDRLANQVYGLLMAAHLMGNDAEEMQADSVIRIDR